MTPRWPLLVLFVAAGCVLSAPSVASLFVDLVPSTARAFGSIRERTPLDRPITQTLWSPTATSSAPSSTEIGGPGVPVRGLIRVTVRSTEFATQTAPSP